MITSNTSIPFIKAENSENKFYISQLTAEYNEGESITTRVTVASNEVKFWHLREKIKTENYN